MIMKKCPILVQFILEFSQVGGMLLRFMTKKEGHRIAPGPFNYEGQKPPEGNSWCGGTGRKKPPCASAMCDMVVFCAVNNAF
jgi:hypothetical protein